MKKRTLITILSITILAAAAIASCLLIFGGEPLKKEVSLKGYSISVPRDWVAAADGTLTDKEGHAVGAFTLIQEKIDFGVPAAVTPMGEVTEQDFSKNTVMCSFLSDQGKTVQYLIKDLPNPAPYAASITLYLDHVSQKTANKIANSFTLPTLGNDPPKKNLSLPTFENIGTDMTAVYKESDNRIFVKNIHLIDAFIRLQNEGKATGLHIISYEKNEAGKEELARWCYIEKTVKQGFMYTYYNGGNGTYTYDNNPLIFESVTKESIEDKGITAFRLKIGDAQTSHLLEIPINLRRDNAEELLRLQKSQADSEAILKILETMLPKNLKSNVSVSKTENHVTLTFSTTDPVTKSGFFQDAAALFALLPDVDTITVENVNGTSFLFKRSETLAKVKTENATASLENFEKFAEELETLAPNEAGTEDGVLPGTVLYSGTVTFSYHTVLTHPRTGNKVKVGPYAERKGLSGYVGKPITITVKKRDTDYIATAVCGGKTIASQTYATLAAAQGAVNLIQAYAG